MTIKLTKTCSWALVLCVLCAAGFITLNQVAANIYPGSNLTIQHSFESDENNPNRIWVQLNVANPTSVAKKSVVSLMQIPGNLIIDESVAAKHDCLISKNNKLVCMHNSIKPNKKKTASVPLLYTGKGPCPLDLKFGWAIVSAMENASASGDQQLMCVANTTTPAFTITNAHADPNGSTVPTGINDIATFEFSGSQAYYESHDITNASLSGIVFTIDADNVEIRTDSITLINKGLRSALADCRLFELDGVTPIDASVTSVVTGQFLAECSNIDKTPESTIPANGALGLAVQADIINPNTGSAYGETSRLNVSLTNYSNYIEGLPEPSFGTGPNDSHLQWVDQNGVETNYVHRGESPRTISSTSYNS